MPSTTQTILLGDREVHVQIDHRPFGADLTFTAGEIPDPLYIERLKTSVYGWSRTLMREGYRVLPRENERAIYLSIGDISPRQLDWCLADLPEELELAWSRKPMAHAASVGSADTG